MNQILNLLFGRKSALLYLLLFAGAVGIATFVENDYGTESAQKVIYQATWFEVLLFLFSGALVKNTIDFKLIKRKLWSVLLFHVSIIIILLGAAITRYSGFEGMMHLREGSSSSQFLSSESYLQLRFQKDGQNYLIEEPVLWSSLGDNHFKESYQLGDEVVAVELQDLWVNPSYQMQSSTAGKPVLKVVFGGAQGRSEYYLSQGEQRQIAGVLFNFGGEGLANAFNIRLNEQGQPEVYSGQAYQVRRMADQETWQVPADSVSALELRSLYQWGDAAFVFGDYQASALLARQSGDMKISSGSKIGLSFKVQMGAESEEVYLEGSKGFLGRPAELRLGDMSLSLAYGAKVRELPFALKLYDFQMERYPGTNSPASYASEVAVVDAEQGKEFDFRIYMNHILNYRGYRFFQSSYDRDELGSYLSVNHDFWGTWVSYLGYFLLTLGMLWTLVEPKSRFRILAQQIAALRNKRAAAMVIMLLSLGLSAQTKVERHLHPVSEAHAELFSKVLVQDINGRMKPAHTLSREILRKLLGREEYRGLNADQVVLSVWSNNAEWYSEPLIKLPYHPKFAEMGFEAERQPYKAFFNTDGSYKLAQAIQAANAVPDKEKGTWEKALLKLDEKVNIFNMMLSGYLLRMVPLEDDANNTWVSAYSHSQERSVVADKLFPAYQEALKRGLQNGDYQMANAIIGELIKYQKQVGGDILPSESQQKLEILLNKLKVFNRLAVYYTLLGLVFLALLFGQVFRAKWQATRLHQILLLLMLAGFIFHTLGLGLRWYVSGRAPWSNGYESMIYIAWTASLAGLLFSRRSSGALAATNVLSGVVLLIAMLSYLNPEITPLVPVLRSYWLTIHVSLEAGSYGFLMLGALIGVINLLLMVFSTARNKQRVQDLIAEMSKLSEMTLTGGLFMLSIGTYLGGVWANESWGRYWGWDAKETWALVSILVYAFILHMRFIPALRGWFAYNFATLFGLASIIMTYYGVNYYLSGLHSYAAGDPVPIPAWVYYSVASLLLLSALAFWRQRRLKA